MDLIVLTSSSSPTPPPRLVGSTVSKLVSAVDIPALIATPYSFENKDKLLTGIDSVGLVCLDIHRIEKALLLAHHIVRRHSSTLYLIVSGKTDRDKVKCVHEELMGKNIKSDLILIDHVGIDDFVEKTLREAEKLKLLIITRQKRLVAKLHLPLLAPKLSAYERAFIGLSPVPIIIV